MRTVNIPAETADSLDGLVAAMQTETPHALQTVDWSTTPQNTLAAVDSVLSEIGYEIVLFDLGSGTLVFSIAKKL